MHKTRVFAYALTGSALAGTAAACFAGTPWQLFDNRKEILAAAPVNSFAWEASHLVAPTKPAIKAVENEDESPDSLAQARDAAEQTGLNPQQLVLLAAMRAAPSPSDALHAGGGLPPETAHYVAGAVAFNHGDAAGSVAQFRAVLGLPSHQAIARSVWAAYMLGRALAATGDRAGAEAAFAQTRALAAQNAPDPLGLAVASLGEQAKLRLGAGDVAGAVALYGEQAADGSASAVQSLRIIAEDAMAHPEKLDGRVRDALVQRLLVVHALAQTGDYLHALYSGGTEFEIGYDGFFSPDEHDDLTPLHILVTAIVRSGVAAPPLDRLASLAYRLGEYGDAKALAEKSGGPLALWVKAKLALRDGGADAAAPAFAAALAASAAQDNTALEPASVTQLRGETGVANLVRGDFMQAMNVMWPVAATYWGDVAYLAERVLTTDELKSFVDAHVPATPGETSSAWNIKPVPELRNLLARRLMRDARYDEALAYFAAPEKDQPDTRAHAAAFANAVRQAKNSFWAADRAKAGWQAAFLLRQNGMEMMGTEISPDQAAMGGMFEGGYGPDVDGPFKQTGEFVAAERARYTASAPKPDARFHYRYLAVDQANEAADEVPPRSQAYAAMLCHATQWMLDTSEDDKAKAIYQRYVKNGAVVPFATHFGHDCPDPDFSKIPDTRRKVAVRRARDLVHHYKWPLGGGGLLILAAAGFVWRKGRK